MLYLTFYDGLFASTFLHISIQLLKDKITINPYTKHFVQWSFYFFFCQPTLVKDGSSTLPLRNKKNDVFKNAKRFAFESSVSALNQIEQSNFPLVLIIAGYYTLSCDSV